MGLTERDAAIILDELGDRGAAVGLPRALGGVPYDELGITGYGVAEAPMLPPQPSRVATQRVPGRPPGLRRGGQAAAERLVELGAMIMAVSTAHGAPSTTGGLDVRGCWRCADELGDHASPQSAGTLDPSAALTGRCSDPDPGRPRGRHHKDLATHTAAKMVVEGANMPTSAAALEVLHERGVTVVPDFVANAGGIVAAAFAMDARYSPFTVNPDDVFPMISSKMRQNTLTVVTEARIRNLTTHAAAQELAQERVHAAMALARSDSRQREMRRQTVSTGGQRGGTPRGARSAIGRSPRPGRRDTPRRRPPRQPSPRVPSSRAST